MSEIITKVWGTEETIFKNNVYCIKFLNLVKGSRCSLHYHYGIEEMLFILEGTIVLRFNNEEIILNKGNQTKVYPFAEHYFTALTETAKILEISNYTYSDDICRIDESRNLTSEELSYYERLYQKPIEDF